MCHSVVLKPQGCKCPRRPNICSMEKSEGFGIAVGIALGVPIGLMLDNVAAGIAIGLAMAIAAGMLLKR